MSNSNRDINAELRKAALEGNIEKVKSLISEGAKVNVKDQDNKTPLHLAAEKGHKEVVEALLDKGANVNAVDKDGKTPFKLAANEEIQTLLENTAKLLEAAREGNIEEVKSLISEGANVHAQDRFGNAPLHWAAGNDNTGAINALLAAGAHVNKENDWGYTPLYLAATYSCKEGVEVLLRANADVNKEGKLFGYTPLHSAAKKDSKEVVEVLLNNGANVNAVNRNGETPLNLATNEEIRTLLIDTALLEAAKSGDINEVKHLISEGADVNAVKGLHTSLYWAAKNGHVSIIEVLLDNGADVAHVNYSMERDVLTLLQEKEAEYCKSSLHLAARLGNLKEVENLLREGADVNVKNDKGKTPLHFAAESGYQQVVQALLDKGADVNIKDKNEKTPLNLAKAEEIKTLLQSAEESDDGSVDESSTDSKGVQEEGAGVNPEHPAPVELSTPTSTLDRDYADNSKKINIFYGQSKYIVNKAALDQNIHNVRKIFSECINDNVEKMSVAVLDKNNLQQHSHIFDGSNSIHVNFDSGNQVLVYSWPHYHQFDENKWNNFLLQLEKDSNVEFIGTGLLQFKYKGFNYRVYPPFVNLEHGEAFDYYRPEVFSFSPTEISQIIEDIKESHQSIEKKIIDHYRSLGKDFVKNDEGYIHIKADIGENNVKNFTDVSYINKSDGIHNNPIEEAFVKDDVGGNLLHLYVYENKEALMRHMFNLSQYNDDNINEVNANGKTPLHLAAKYGRGAMVEMLLNKGAKVDVVDSRGRTPLHWVAQNNNKEIVDALIKAKANVNIKDEDGKTPFDLAEDDGIKILLQSVEESDDVNPVDKSSTGSEGVQEEEEEDSNQSQREQDINGEKGTDVTTGSAQPVAPTEPAQTEEQPSSFFGSLFSILMKPFSLIASFFGGFFSWLFCSDTDESTSQTDADVSLLKLNSSGEKKTDAQPGNHSSLAPNQSAGQVDTLQLGADDNQLLG
ncbi:ankyrin repeat domain-containing protein [Wolbachia endosymbiont (group A) of Cheilosia soror]|uniref:ankyrin repeat domain-containing protein n=1 Tax=Wolbachia endosymbiont (group A) of Cheilosia soror TaxID=2953995 RepID=UPI0021F8E4F6|nr:ankyrin repeat domain-containing protein [Wolbachia endosymbiont (group A) of Cheilosia soror]